MKWGEGKSKGKPTQYLLIWESDGYELLDTENAVKEKIRELLDEEECSISDISLYTATELGFDVQVVVKE